MRYRLLGSGGLRGAELCLGSALGCLDFEPTRDQVRRLEEVSGFSVGFPRSFPESGEVRGLIFGGTFDAIDDHRRGRP